MPPLPLASIPHGEDVLIDANVLVYGALALSAQCQELLRRCALRDLSGFTTIETLSDACHRLMVGEAAGRGLIARPNAANLQGKPHVVRVLLERQPKHGCDRSERCARPSRTSRSR